MTNITVKRCSIFPSLNLPQIKKKKHTGVAIKIEILYIEILHVECLFLKYKKILICHYIYFLESLHIYLTLFHFQVLE